METRFNCFEWFPLLGWTSFGQVFVPILKRIQRTEICNMNKLWVFEIRGSKGSNLDYPWPVRYHTEASVNILVLRSVSVLTRRLHCKWVNFQDTVKLQQRCFFVEFLSPSSISCCATPMPDFVFLVYCEIDHWIIIFLRTKVKNPEVETQKYEVVNWCPSANLHLFVVYVQSLIQLNFNAKNKYSQQS